MRRAFLIKILLVCFLVLILQTKKVRQIMKVKVKNDDANIDIRNNDNTSDEERRRYNNSAKTEKNEMAERNEHIDNMIERLKFEDFYPARFWNTNLAQLTRELGNKTRRNAKTLSGYANTTGKDNVPTWKLLNANIRQFSLYDPDDPNLEKWLNEMANLPIISAEMLPDRISGTMFKLIFEFSNHGYAMMKPMRYPREVEDDENVLVSDIKERHIAEIAAFQLDKLLGFYRVPPTIGRKINITRELMPVAPSSVTDTLFISPAENLCFYGECEFFCDSAHAFCGHPDIIEISLMTFLPSEEIAPKQKCRQPWIRSYSIHRKARWETNDDACDSVRSKSPYNNGKLLQDIVDMHTFDFLTGNKDRHTIEMFKEFHYYSFPILYDNGSGFGRQTYDAMSILAPLRQCCLIRKSTLLKYIKLYTGTEKLSFLMEKALESDPVAPVLIRGHLNALDRRLVKILQTVADCLATRATDDVIVSDEF